jgi:CSLREA domain-containing protein/uncharacterized repeat protein (TIGR01451 family)
MKQFYRRTERRWSHWWLAPMCLAFLWMLVLHQPAQAQTTIIVTTADDVVADDGVCSLREAITTANTDTASGAAAGECPAGSGSDTITFGLSGSGVHSVTVSSMLPPISEPVTIDGASQSIVLDGTGVDMMLNVTAADSTVRNLTFANFVNAALEVNNANNVTLENLELSAANACAFDATTGLRTVNSNNLTIQNVAVRNRGTGMVISGGNTIVVEGNDFQGAGCGNGTAALRLQSLTDVQVQNNSFISATAGLILSGMSNVVISSTVPATSTNYVVLEADSGIGTGGGISLMLENVHNSSVQGIDLSRTGACDFGISGTGLYVTVSNNLTIQDVAARNRGVGMHIGNGDGLVLKGNDLQGSGCANAAAALQLIRMTNVQAQENSFVGAFAGVALEAMSDVVISGTMPVSATNAIVLEADSGLGDGPGMSLVLNNVDNSTVQGVDLSRTSACDLSSAGTGLYADGSDNLTIRDVTVHNRGYGIGIRNSQNVLVDTADLAGSGCANAGYSVAVNNSTVVSLTNLVIDSGAYGVLVEGSTDDLTVTCSSIRDTNTGLFYAGSGATLLVHDNIFDGNGIGFSNNSAHALVAENNFWGAANGPSNLGGSGNSYVGTVDADPFQASPAACAPVMTYTLTTATNGTGSGSVSLNPPGGTYTYPTVVTAIASADPGSTFAGWSGACTGLVPCVLAMKDHYTLAATFDIALPSPTPSPTSVTPTATATTPTSMTPTATATMPSACTLTVTNTNDNGPGSLRQAIASANPFCNQIIFDAGLTGQTIRLVSELIIAKNLTIDGSGRRITISGDTDNNGSGNVPVFTINGGKVTLSHLTIADGFGADGLGGGVSISPGAHVHILQSTIRNNISDNGSIFSSGGGIYNTGVLTLTNSTVSGNQAAGLIGVGGGIYSGYGSVATILYSTITGNIAANGSGGGFNIEGASVTLIGSIVSGNSAATGPEIDVNNGGRLDLSRYNVFGFNGNAGLRNAFPSGSDRVAPGPLASILNATLADNGGDSVTHNLVMGGPAYNMIPPNEQGCGTTINQDQRGLARPAANACDAGAVEAGATAATPTATAPMPTATQTPPATVTPTPTLMPSPTNTSIPPTATMPPPSPTPTATTPAQQACTGDALWTLLNSTSSTINLDGNCHYQITSSYSSNALIDLWNKQNVVIDGHGATIERMDSAPEKGILGIFYGVNVTIKNVTFKGGKALTGNAVGGGVWVYQSTLLVENVRFLENTAKYGGGMLVDNPDSRVAILNSVFADNVSTSSGDALYAKAKVFVRNSTFANQVVSPRQAIFAWQPLDIRNSIIANFEAAIWAGGSTTTVTEDYNVFSGQNTVIVPVNGANFTQGGHSQTVVDPRFVAPTVHNYRLQANSPAIDKGTMLDSKLDADGRPRPFAGTRVDAGAYEFQGVGVPALSIIKSSPYWVQANRPFVYELTVANQGVTPALDLIIIDQVPGGVTPLPATASNGGVIENGIVRWSIGDLAPGQSKTVTYQARTAQTVASNQYTVRSNANPGVLAAGQTMTTTVNTRLIANLNFFPEPDGFSFPNYTDSPDSDLTVDDMIFIYGADKVCKTQNPCVLTAAAESWRKAWIENVKGGHCAGMAMGSLDIFFNPSVAPGDFQTGAIRTFDLNKENVRRYIALYATTQTRYPTTWRELQTQGLPWTVGGAPVAVLDALIANLANPNATDRYRLSISKAPAAGGGGGHTVVPFAVEQINANEYWIYVYENNAPDNYTRAVRVNRTTNTWSYIGTTAPNQPLSNYYGDATTNNLDLVSWKWATTFPKYCDTACATATAQSAGMGQQDGEILEFQLDGEGYLLITRSDGKRAGFDPITGAWIGEIEGAAQVDILTGLGLNTSPAIQLPHVTGMTYQAQVSSRETAFGNSEATANVNIFGAGFAVRLIGLQINSPEAVPVPLGSQSVAAAQTGPYEQMNIGFDPDNKQIIYQASNRDGDTPALSLAISSQSGADYTVELSNLAVGSNESVALTFDEATGKLTVENNDSANNSYAIAVERINTDGSKDVYTNPSVSDGDGVGAIIDIGSGWNGSDAPTIEENTTPTLPPAWTDYLFLPLVQQ